MNPFRTPRLKLYIFESTSRLGDSPSNGWSSPAGRSTTPRAVRSAPELGLSRPGVAPADDRLDLHPGRSVAGWLRRSRCPPSRVDTPDTRAVVLVRLRPWPRSFAVRSHFSPSLIESLPSQFEHSFRPFAGRRLTTAPPASVSPRRRPSTFDSPGLSRDDPGVPVWRLTLDSCSHVDEFASRCARLAPAPRSTNDCGYSPRSRTR